MKAKTLSMFSLSVLVMILLLGVASAAITFDPTSLSGSGDQGTTASINFDINNTATQNMTNITTYLTTLTSGSNTISTSALSLIGVPSYLEGLDGESITLDVVIPASQATGTYTGNVTFEGTYTNATNYTVSVSLSVTEDEEEDEDTNFCGSIFGELESNISNPGKLRIEIDDLDNEGIGKSDEWYPSDSIKITIKVENKGDDDVDDISLSWGLWSEVDDKWVIEIDEEESFDLNDGKDDEYEFTIDLYDDFEDVDDIKDGKYVLYTRINGEIDEDNDTETCEYDSKEVDIIVDDDLVVLDDIKLTGTTFCGNIVQVTADILNIGDDDQDEVFIRIRSSELGISENADVGEIEAFEDKTLDFEFTIPKDAEEKQYYILLDVFDDSNDIYESSDDDKSTYKVLVDVSGNCQKTPDAVVYASLESGGEEGEEIQIRASVTNNGDETDTFTVSAADYSSWAELVSITPTEITLDSDKSTDVILTFDIKDDVEESQSLSIVITNSDGESTTSPLAVTVDTGFSLPSMIKDNGYLWGIALVNIILIVVIVLVAVKVTRR